MNCSPLLCVCTSIFVHEIPLHKLVFFLRHTPSLLSPSPSAFFPQARLIPTLTLMKRRRSPCQRERWPGWWRRWRRKRNWSPPSGTSRGGWSGGSRTWSNLLYLTCFPASHKSSSPQPRITEPSCEHFISGQRENTNITWWIGNFTFSRYESQHVFTHFEFYVWHNFSSQTIKCALPPNLQLPNIWVWNHYSSENFTWN